MSKKHKVIIQFSGKNLQLVLSALEIAMNDISKTLARCDLRDDIPVKALDKKLKDLDDMRDYIIKKIHHSNKEISE